jgi:hypothetical protein
MKEENLNWDGVPEHKIDDSDIYVPPVSVKDIANAVYKRYSI